MVQMLLVVNIITKKISNEWITSTTVSQTIQTNSIYGDDKNIDIAVMGPLIKDKLGVAIRASKYNKEASNPEFKDTIDPNGNLVDRSLGYGAGGRTVANENYNLGARLAYKPHEKHEIVFDIDTSRQEYDNSDSQVGTLDGIESIWRAAGGIVAPRVGYKDEQQFQRDQYSIAYNADWDFAKSVLNMYNVTTKNLGRSLPFSVQDREALQQLWNASSGNMSSLTLDQRTELESFLLRPDRIMETRQLTVDGKIDIPLDEHLVVLGFQYIDAEMEDGVFGMDGDGYKAGTVQPHKQWALFAEENWNAFEDFTLTVGGRYDRHEVFGSNVSPRVYGVYNFMNDFTIKGGVGTGYKTPKTSDLFSGITGFGGQGTSPFVGTPDLEPEKSINKEIAFYYSNKRNDTFNITYFQNDFKDKIQTAQNVPNCEASNVEGCIDIGGGWNDLGYTSFSQKENIDKAIIRGVEIAAKVYITPEIALRGNYTYTDSKQKSGIKKGQPLSGSAKQMYNAAIDWMPSKDISTYLILTGEKGRFRSFDAVAQELLYYKDYNVLNMGASYKANKNVTFTGRINNLLDRDFTTYTTTFSTADSGVTYTPTYLDDYNTKAKSREFWFSINVKI